MCCDAKLGGSGANHTTFVGVLSMEICAGMREFGSSALFGSRCGRSNRFVLLATFLRHLAFGMAGIYWLFIGCQRPR